MTIRQANLIIKAVVRTGVPIGPIPVDDRNRISFAREMVHLVADAYYGAPLLMTDVMAEVLDINLGHHRHTGRHTNTA